MHYTREMDGETVATKIAVLVSEYPYDETILA